MACPSEPSLPAVLLRVPGAQRRLEEGAYLLGRAFYQKLTFPQITVPPGMADVDGLLPLFGLWVSVFLGTLTLTLLCLD